MRLQLSIKRCSLPTTDIIFTTRAFGPCPATSNPDATIAQLLEDVNDIIPLESANWGLEDYAVEVNGYECLHFSPIDAVLRDDDQVVIRALKTQDLRSRRLGGRHQVSSDGRHLIDGVAFGRQWLKKGGRPAVQIPSRKRRLKIEGLGDDREKEAARQLTLAGVNNADQLAYEEGDEEEDSDFVGEDIDALVDDENDAEAGPRFVIDTQPDLQIVARQDFQDADDEALDSSEEDDSDDDAWDEEAGLELSADLQALREEKHSYNSKFHAEQQGSLDQTLLSDGGEIRTSGRKRKLTVYHETLDGDEIEFNGFSSPLGKRGKTDKYRALSESESDSTSSSGSGSDKDRERGASLPASKKLNSWDGSAHSGSSSDSFEEWSSSSSDSDNDAVSDGESSGSSSSSSQTSDVTNSNEEVPSGTVANGNSTVSPKKATFASVTHSVTPRPHVPPGQGLKRTHYTNQRQKKRHRLKTLKEQGLLPENATFTDLAVYDETHQTASLGPAAVVAKVIEAKKQELLGKVDEHMQDKVTGKVVEKNPYLAREATDKNVRTTHSKTFYTETAVTNPSSEQLQRPDTLLHKKPVNDLVAALLTPTIETKSEPPKQRARLDLNSTRNMIFNGLGVRKPKTAAAEQALREKLGKPVKGALPKQLFKDAATDQEEGAARQDESQLPWQDKLILSAVECELQGVTLKDPPFPFVQGWDEDANRRLRNSKKKGRNQRQYYAYDDATFMDAYEEERGEGRDENDSMVQDEANGHERLDKLTIKASNLISEAREQLDTTADNLAAKEAEDLPHPDNIDSLHTLQQQDTLPGAVIAYKEFHLNATNFQPEISAYRIARIEAVHDDETLDLTLSKQDRKPPKVAQYDEETGQRILSRFEMWEGSDDAGEDDGSRHLSYSDLIEPKLVQASAITKPAASKSASEGDNEPNRLSASAPDSAAIPESAFSDSFGLLSAQQPVHVARVAETEIDIDIDVATPRRTEISAMIKEAGFNSTIDSDIGRPSNGVMGRAQYSSPGLGVTEDSQSQSRMMSADPAYEAQQTALDTSEFDSPRFNGWSSSPPLEPEPDEIIEETGLNELENSSHNQDTQPKRAADDQYLTPKDDVTYPHVSQLELDSSLLESSAAELRGGSGGSSSAESPPRNNLDDAGLLGNSNIEVVEEGHLDSLKSVDPPSIDQSQQAGDESAREPIAPTTFLGGRDGQVSSDDNELPSLGRITSTARSRSPRVWPPRIRRGEGKALRPRGSTSPFAESTASGSEQRCMKQSQSQVRLSQIPPGAQVVDLTFSSDAVSPGKDDGDYTKTKRLPRTSNKGKRGTSGAGADTSDALAASVGLGNRRLLKSKKAKP